MLTYMSLEQDSQPVRAAKLKALQAYFDTANAKPFAMLPADALAPENPARGKILVVNSHGNGSVFAGHDARQFLEMLQEKGLAEGAFPSIYLMACNVGEQAQDNSILNNFARDLKALLNQNGIEVKLYAPRGTLTYSLTGEISHGETYYRVTRMFIRTPERDYPLEEGMLLVA